jgi:hypothetical protein
MWHLIRVNNDYLKRVGSRTARPGRPECELAHPTAYHDEQPQNRSLYSKLYEQIA